MSYPGYIDPDDYDAILDPDQIPDLNLRVGDGDGFLTVLANKRDRLVIGTPHGWNRAIIVWFAAIGFAAFGALITAANSRGVGAIFSLACSLIWLGLGFALGLYLARVFRAQYVFEAPGGKVTRTTLFGLSKYLVHSKAITDVGVGEVFYLEELHGEWRLSDEPSVLSIILFNRSGDEMLEIHGVPADQPEATFYVAAGARLADILSTLLVLPKLPESSCPSVRALWSALTRPSQARADRWTQRHGLAPKRPQLFQPWVVYAVLALIGLLSLASATRSR